MLVTAVLAMVLGNLTNRVWAAADNWVSPSSGDWFIPGNWSLATPPAPTETLNPLAFQKRVLRVMYLS